jgi:hypothetical protein
MLQQVKSIFKRIAKKTKPTLKKKLRMGKIAMKKKNYH